MNDIQPIRKIALDIGNGNMKGAEVRSGQVVTVSLPSQVGVGDTNLGALSLGGVSKRRRELKPVPVQFDGGNYLVGHNVARYARPLERMDAGKYVDSMEVRALTYATLSQLLGDGGANQLVQTELAMMVALPVDVLMASNAKETIKGIKAWLLGEHRFACNGQEVQARVRAVRAMAQPVGAFFAWGMNSAGQWMQPDEYLTEASVAVLDSGFNTLDLLVVKAGHIEKRYTGGETLGVRRAVEEIQRVIKVQFNFTLSLAEVDDYIRAYLDNRITHIIVAGHKHDLKPIIRQALNNLATRTIGFVEENWGTASQFSYVLLAGGGALVLYTFINRHIPHATLLPDPVTANAVGLACLAQRPGVFKES